jgi:hypothetical protein
MSLNFYEADQPLNQPTGVPVRSRRPVRAWAASLAIAGALLVSACGGGGGGDDGYTRINVGVAVGGQPPRDVIVDQGGAFDLALRAGESVTLVAGEPVVWTLFVGGAAVGTGVEVFYAGVNLTATRLDAYAVNLATFAQFRLAAPIAVTLVATSPYDSAQIAAVNILITD